ncbi:MAG TPA: leucine--tRNA ligase [Gaiellaceae bacterium]|nr:leucine--tRNA ligase [Gaiellaceae bacterium]
MSETEAYDPQAIEPKWQRVWEEARAWEVPNPVGDEAASQPKSYVLEQLPYPSGSLHMGHMLVYTIGDVATHFRRRNGFRVLHPMGWDAFGLPAENAALRGGGHPRETTERNIVNIRRSMRRIGWWLDWSRELSTHDPAYYRWQQWQFLRFLERGLAYRKGAPVKWCPNDQTVVANEQVLADGTCERCGAEVESRLMEQWFFRITDYAQALLDDLDTVDWPESIKARQRNWIGRSEGAEIVFRIEELDVDVPVFTTRADTLFGATFFALAPEHELVRRIESPEVQDYARKAAAKKTEERAAAAEKTGVFTGLHVVNPVNGERLPVYVADYVLTDYGTGALMAVPAHDDRDLAFARAFDLPVREVVRPAGGEEADVPYVGKSESDVLVNSGEFDGLPAPDGGRRIVERLEREGRGRFTVNYRLRDWGFSRQRYWGSPIPIVYCDACGIVPVPDDELPVLLPDVEDYKPQGRPPLAQAEDWVRTACPACGGEGRRETETMDTFVDSSWYFLRYCDPANESAPFDRTLVDFWNPVDLYIGGVDHATMHMIYARFWVKVLNDLGYVGFREPFASFFSNGWVTSGKTKISKRSGASVGPDEVVGRYGADPVRLCILFLGPADENMEWTEEAAEGMARFVRRLWRVVNEVAAQAPAAGGDGAGGPLARKAHETIAKVTDDVGRRFAFNTGISAVMELVNELSRDPAGPDARFAAETAVSLLQPYAPHVTEELWERLGHERLWEQPWPVADPAMLERDMIEVVVQVNGKLRDRLQVAAATPEDELVALARASERVRAHLDGGEPRKTIVVPGKLVNFVV